MSENNQNDYFFNAMAEVMADADEASTSKKSTAVEVNKKKDCNLPKDSDGKLNAGAKYKNANKGKLTKDLCAPHNDTIEEKQIEGPTNSLNAPAKDLQSVQTEKDVYDLSHIKPIEKQPREWSCVQTPKQKAASLNRIRDWIAAKSAARAMKAAPVALPIDKPSGSKLVFAPPQNQSAKKDHSGAGSSSNLTARAMKAAPVALPIDKPSGSKLVFAPPQNQSAKKDHSGAGSSSNLTARAMKAAPVALPIDKPSGSKSAKKDHSGAGSSSNLTARAMKPAPVALPIDKPSGSKLVFAPPQNQSAKKDLSGAGSSSNLTARAMKPAPVALPIDKPSGSKLVFAPPQNQSAKKDLSGAGSSSNLTAPESTDDVVTIGNNENNREVDLTDENNKTIVISPQHEAESEDSDEDNPTTTHHRQGEHKLKGYACMSTSKMQKIAKNSKQNKKINNAYPLNKKNSEVGSPSTSTTGAGISPPPYVLRNFVVKLKRCCINTTVVAPVAPPDDEENKAEDATERNVTE